MAVMKDFVAKYSEQDYGSLGEPSVNSIEDEAGLTYTEYFQNSSEDERNLVLNLCELFNEIDFAGEKYITWDDFMSYLLDAVSDQTTKEDQIKEVCGSALLFEYIIVINSMDYLLPLLVLKLMMPLKKCVTLKIGIKL